MRGDIHRLKAPKGQMGHEQRGARYAVVLQSDYLPLSTVLVAPTSTSCTPTTFRPPIQCGSETTWVMVEQTAAVDVETRLGEMVGRVTLAEMQAIEGALQSVLGLD